MTAELRFVHISDLHILGGEGERAYGADTQRILRQAVARINGLRPDFVVATGDLSGDGSRASYERLRTLLAPLASPLHACPGNHDDPDGLRWALGLPAGAPAAAVHDAFDAAGHRFLLVDSSEPGKPSGRLAPEELGWLEARLTEAPDRPTWLFLHHQPLPVYIRWLDEIGLANGEALLALLRRHVQVRGVGYGHVHLPRRWRYGGALFASAPALAFQVSPLSQEPEVTLDPAGFRLVELAAGGEVRDWLYYLDHRIEPQPRREATPVYVPWSGLQGGAPAVQ